MSLRTPILAKLWRFIPLIICCVFLRFTAQAAVIDEIAQDFKPLSGYVVMVSEGEYVIDLDAGQGVVAGDVFSVLQKGAPIVHPVTQKVLGNLEQVKGLLKVTRIKSGFSMARRVGQASDAEADIKRGDPIRRYADLKALFWDYTSGGAQVFFIRLQSALPALKWQDYAAAQRLRPPKPEAPAALTTAIYFILTDSGIEVRDPEFALLHQYGLPEPIAAVPAEPAVAGKLPVSTAPALTVPLPTPGASGGVPQVGPEIVSEQAAFRGNLAGIAVMADFIRQGDRLLMAATDGADITVYTISDEISVNVEGDTPFPGQILALKWWQPEAKGPLYLAVVTWSDNAVLSTLFVVDAGKLNPIKSRIQGILGSFDLDGDRRPETLFNQEFDKDDFFGWRVKELKLIDGRVQYQQPALPLPRRFTVLGSLFADLTGDGHLETVFVRDGILYIYAGREQIYASSKQMGGSLSFLTYAVNPHAKNVMTTSAAFEISPVVADIDDDGQPEVLAASSDRNIIGTVGIGPGIRSSRLAVVKFENGRFVTGRFGAEMESAVQGLTVSDHELLFVASEAASQFRAGGRSQLLAYRLGRRTAR